MKNIILTLLVLIPCVVLSQSKRVYKSTTISGEKVEYAIQLPKNFDPSKSYPVAIGPSEVKKDDDQSFYWRGIEDTKGWILIDFRLYQPKPVAGFLDFIRTKYKVEGNKYHTVCFSANSAGIFDLVMKTPGYFHSITGMAGNPSTRNASDLKKLKNVKVRFIVGDKDTYWMNAAKDRHQRLLEAGINSEIEIVKNGKHVLTSYIGEKMIEHFEGLR